MQSQTKKRSKWLWLASVVVVFSLTGCGIHSMYPAKPGDWPTNFWGNVLQVVSHAIDFFAHHLWGSYGLALLAVTVIVRIIVLPFFVKQMRHTKSMQAIQPEIQKIRAKYKGDNQKIQQETSKLWQQHGVNPMAGCFPMLIQMPVLYALFGAIEGNVHLNNSTFLGIFQLGHPDHTYILPIVAAITTYLSSRVMMTGNDGQQKMMLFIMPVFIFFIGSRMPAGLALYWIYTNVFTAAQGYFVKVRPAQAGTGGAMAAAVAGAGSAAKVGSPSSAKNSSSSSKSSTKKKSVQSSQKATSSKGSSNSSNKNGTKKASKTTAAKGSASKTSESDNTDPETKSAGSGESENSSSTSATSSESGKTTTRRSGSAGSSGKSGSNKKQGSNSKKKK